MTYELISVPSSKHKGAVSRCTKWKVFTEEGEDKNVIKRNVPGKVAFPRGEELSLREKKPLGVSSRVLHLPLGAGEGPCGRLTGADRKIPDLLKLHFWGRLKLQLDYVSPLVWGLGLRDAILGLWFSF